MNEQPTITICETELAVKEFEGQRVVTFRDIDTLHRRPDGTASRNFRENKERFIESLDFFRVNQPDEIRRLGLERPQGGTPASVTLLTETGYLMLVKSFTDDLAWAVQRQLVNLYFHIREASRNVPPLLPESAGGVARLICAIRAVMQDNGQPSEVITQTVKGICDQFGLKLPPNFVRVPAFQQITLFGIL